MCEVMLTEPPILSIITLIYHPFFHHNYLISLLWSCSKNCREKNSDNGRWFNSEWAFNSWCFATRCTMPARIPMLWMVWLFHEARWLWWRNFPWIFLDIFRRKSHRKRIRSCGNKGKILASHDFLATHSYVANTKFQRLSIWHC